MSSLRHAVLSSLAIALGILASLWIPAHPGFDASGPAGAASLAQGGNPRQSPCVLDLQQRAWPPLMLMGETTQLQTRVRANCPISDTPTHIVMVVDGSGSMAGQPTQETKRALREFVDALDLPNNPSTRVGVVEFNSNARTLCQLTNQVGRVTSCIGRVGADGGTAIDRGIQEGIKVLRQGRNLAPGQVIHEIMILISGSANVEGCNPVQQAARSAKSQGILLITICVGAGCDAACMREAASSARYFYQAAGAFDLDPILERIRDEVLEVLLRQLVLVTTLPATMDYVPDSAQPPADVSPDGKRFEWQRDFLSADGMTVTLSVRPLQTGGHPVTLSTTVECRDQQNRSGSASGVAPWVHVFGPVVQPRP